MAVIDTRAGSTFQHINELLLRVAESPLQFTEYVTTGPGPSRNVPSAAYLARQASASIICNCVVEIWSQTVSLLNALEPEFPLYPKNVSNFVKDTRLPFLSYMSIYYSMCKRPFHGTMTQRDTAILVDIRHEIQHDKPESSETYSTARIDSILKWRKRLESVLSSDDLLWLPRVRETPEKFGFELGSEPAIMKFMKFTLAKWAICTTANICKEMSDMMFQYTGAKKLHPGYTGMEDFDERLGKDEQLMRLWKAGE